jgi:long-chain acyl-CoA synthetase
VSGRDRGREGVASVAELFDAGAAGTDDSPSAEPLGAVPVAAGRLDEALRTAAGRWPDQVALRHGLRTLTYAELDREVDRYAERIRANVRARTAIALGAVAGLDFPIAYYGVIRSGNVATVVNPFLTGPSPKAVRSLDRAVAEFDDVANGEAAAHIAAVMFTSGSTGRSKAVAASHAALGACAWQLGRVHGLRPGTVILNCLPLCHPMHLNAGIRAGATQVIAPNPADVPAEAVACQAEVMYALPYQVSRLATGAVSADRAAAGLPSLQVVASGGAPVHPTVVFQLRERFGFALLQGYGLTETCGLAHSDLRDRPRPGSVGPAVPGGESRIRDLATGALLAPGHVGAIEVRGPQLMAGYADAPPGTTSPDPAGWLATGDAGRLDERGRLHLLDRVADLFYCGGELVSPTAVESRLAAHPAVRECLVVGVADPGLGTVPAAVVVLRDGDADVDRVIEEVNEGLDREAQIRVVVARDAVPRLTNGKPARARMRAELDEARQGS